MVLASLRVLLLLVEASYAPPLGFHHLSPNVQFSEFPSDESGNLLNMIMDSGAEEHVVSLADWKSLREPVLKPAQVRLRSATGDGVGVSGSVMVRGWCDNQMVVDSSGGGSSYKISVFSDEAGECWLQHRYEANSVCFASQWRLLHTASTLRQA